MPQKSSLIAPDQTMDETALPAGNGTARYVAQKRGLKQSPQMTTKRYYILLLAEGTLLLSA